MDRLRLAVIDADSGFVQVLTKRMSAMGWEYRTLASAVPPEELVAMRINCLVVDLELLGHGAWDFLERVCEQIPGLGVIVATPRSTVAQRVRGLRLGADDWVGKPCHPEEVIARVEAVVRRRRRAAGPAERKPIVAGELEIRADQFQAYVDGQSLDLTRREFELLQLLSQAAGQVLPREEIYQRVWGYAMAHGDRSVDVFVRKLRQKLETASPRWGYIHTHFGIGYRFDPEASDEALEQAVAAAPAPEPETAARLEELPSRV
jgi:DNA-binding response OmpR family regulator